MNVLLDRLQLISDAPKLKQQSPGVMLVRAYRSRLIAPYLSSSLQNLLPAALLICSTKCPRPCLSVCFWAMTRLVAPNFNRTICKQGMIRYSRSRSRTWHLCSFYFSAGHACFSSKCSAQATSDHLSNLESLKRRHLLVIHFQRLTGHFRVKALYDQQFNLKTSS